jgi:hypothetical protein
VHILPIGACNFGVLFSLTAGVVVMETIALIAAVLVCDTASYFACDFYGA